MRRSSVSARIFGGFLLVMLAFGGVMSFLVYRMNDVRRELELIESRYLRLTLVLGELDTYQSYLIAELESIARPSRFLRRQVQLFQQYRLSRVRKALRLASLEKLDASTHNRQVLERTRARLRALQGAFKRNAPLLERFARRSSARGATASRAVNQGRRTLLRSERRLATTIQRLRDEVRSQVSDAAQQVEADQRHTVWAGLALVLLALMVSGAATVYARRTLRPLRTLVDGTKRIGSGDYAGRVQVESRDELGLLAQEFNNMAAAVQEREQRLIRSERLAAAGQLASHITHEVRNPLNSISLNTEMLEEELSGLPEQRRDEALAICRAVQREVDRLTEITEEYLRFARLPKPTLEPIEIDDLLADLLAFLAGELSRRGVRCEMEHDDELPAIAGDDNQLRQAFINLLRNAAEAMGQGDGTLRITTHAASGAVEIRIADSGSGIAEEHRAQVFEPFFSTKSGGTGLGLALTQQIIHEHGGTIEVDSELGVGTTFAVKLPVASARDRV